MTASTISGSYRPTRSPGEQLPNATVIAPALGIAATEAEVGVQNQGTIAVQQSIGTPGVDNPSFSPQARFAPTNSSINAVASNYHLTASGLASANLATGQLKVGAASIYQSLSIPGNSQPSDFTVGTFAQAIMSDVLTINGDIPSPVTVRLSMSVSGSIQADGLGDPTPNDSNTQIASFELTGGYPNAQFTIGNLQGGILTYSKNSRQGGVDIKSAVTGNISITLYNDFVISASSRQIPFEAFALAEPVGPNSYGSVISDFEHTANLSISLPSNLSYTSLSGKFLTESQTGPTNVPEPSSFGIILISVLGLASIHFSLGRSRY